MAWKSLHAISVLMVVLAIMVGVGTATWGIIGSFIVRHATLIASCILVLFGMSFFILRFWFAKAVKGRRTPGHAEIQTSSADLIEPSLQRLHREGEHDIFAPPSPAREPWVRDQTSQIVADLSSQKGVIEPHESPEDRLFVAFSRYSSSLTREVFHEVFSCMDWVHLNAGEILWTPGRAPDGVYMVVDGVLCQHRPIGKNTQNPAEISPLSSSTPETSLRKSPAAYGPAVNRYQHGDVFGEISLLTGLPRSSTCVADTEAEIVRISLEEFEKLLKQLPHVMVSLLRSVMARHWRVAHFVLDAFFGISKEEPESCELQPLYTHFEGDGAELDTLPTVSLASGQLVFSVGSQQRKKLLLLREGRVCLTPKEAGREQISGHAIEIDASEKPVFGGIPFVTDCPHLATLRCLTPCKFVSVSVDDFQATPVSSLVDAIINTCRTMCKLLLRFEDYGLKRRWLRAGTILFHVNEFASDVYIVVSGRLRIFTPPSRRRGAASNGRDGYKTLLEIGRGECVGEMSLLAGDDTHSHSCISVRDSEIVCLPRESFRVLEANRMVLLRRFASTMAKRLREMTSPGTSSALGSKVATIAVVPASAGVKVEDFVENLSNALEFYGSVFHINHSTMQQMAEEDDTLGRLTNWDNDERIFRSHVAHFLTDLEESHDFLMFSGDHSRLEWTRCCVRQADYIFVVGNAQESPIVSSFEKELLWASEQTMSLSRKDLVLLHDESTRLPSGTRHWLDHRRCDAFHHVRIGASESYARLARVICRRTVGVVCSGGGARGLAHMGTFRALQELDVPIDYVAGTSQGAFMGALFAMHFADDMEPIVRRFASRMGSVWELILDATLPVVSYFSGRKFSESIRDYFGDSVRIEDLWIPYFCVTTNLTKADVRIHQTGVLWKAVRASMSIVDYLPPMYVDGELLIDGGYIDNLPVDIMKEVHRVDVLIGVDVENKSSPFRNIQNYGLFLSGWWLMWLKVKGYILPFSTPVKVPRFSEIVTSLKYMNHARNIRSFLDDKIINVYIRPELGDTLLLDYHRYEEISELGYRYTKAAVSKWVLQNRSLVHALRGRVGRQFMSSPNLKSLDRLNAQPLRRSSGGSIHVSPRVSVTPSKHIRHKSASTTDSMT